MGWLSLLMAGALEIVWILALKYSDGFTRFGPSLVMIVAIGLSAVRATAQVGAFRDRLCGLDWDRRGRRCDRRRHAVRRAGRPRAHLLPDHDRRRNRRPASRHAGLIGIGVLDLGVGGLAIYVLLPDLPPIDYITVLVIYVTAILLGFLSHAPGSLGVFEAAVLIALPQFAKEELLASLLIFRCLYFVLPLFLAVSIMAVREMWLASR